MTGKRNIAAIQLADFEPIAIPTDRPEVTWIDPRELLVDEAYQRNLSERSIALIRRIAAGWDWRRFKAPNCAWTADGLEVIDGQHTAIGAACREDVPEIPVLITEAKEQADRAAAFIGLNRDRVGITATQLHAAAVTAGDADAMAIEKACAAHGIVVLKSQPGAGKFRPRETMAVAAIGALVKRDDQIAAQVLRALAEADLAPIQANHIKAVELLLTDPEFGEPSAADVTKAIVAVGVDAEKEARLFGATHRVPLWRGLTSVWFKKMLRRRRPVAEPQDEHDRPKPDPSLSDVKRDQRPPLKGWQSGRYMRRCTACDCRFEGAVNSTKCADCAYGEA